MVCSDNSKSEQSPRADTWPDVMLNHINGLELASASSPVMLPFACEASWVTGKWEKLDEYVGRASKASGGSFNVEVGRALLALARKEKEAFVQIVDEVRRKTVKSLSPANTASLQACHDVLLKLHALTEIEAISAEEKHDDSTDKSALVVSLEQRLDLLGAFNSDKQFLLGLRRAVMQSSR